MAEELQKVKPGDLITAKLINAIIDELVFLRGKTVPQPQQPNPVGISGFLPSAAVHVDEEITMLGWGFGDPSRDVVTIGEGVVRDFKTPGSGGERLIFKVPPLEDLGTGKVFDVSVGALAGTAYLEKGLLVMPSEPSLPEGQMHIFPSGNPQIKLQTDPVDYKYTLEISSNMEETYEVWAEAVGTGWKAAVIDPSGGTFTVPKTVAPLKATRYMTVRVTPGTAANATVTVHARSKKNQSWQTSRPDLFTLGTVGPAAQGVITVSWDNFVGTGGWKETDGKVGVPVDTEVTIGFKVAVTAQATCKVDSVKFIDLNGAAAVGWSAPTVGLSTPTPIPAGQSSPFKMGVKASSAAGTTKEVTLIVKVASPADSGEGTVNLRVGVHP